MDSVGWLRMFKQKVIEEIKKFNIEDCYELEDRINKVYCDTLESIVSFKEFKEKEKDETP